MSDDNGIYTEKLPSYGCKMTVEEWRKQVAERLFIDYDGFCTAVKGNRMGRIHYYPSDAANLPSDATHVMWFNR